MKMRKSDSVCSRNNVRRLAIVAALGLLLSPAIATASRTISLPHEERFDTNTWLSDIAVPSNTGGTVTWVSNGGWRGGGAARITPPTLNEGYSGLGAFTGFRSARLNVRYLVLFGTSFADKAQGSKYVIMNREGDTGQINRPMLLDSNNNVNSVRNRFWNPCSGIVCESPIPGNRYYQPFTVTSTSRANEWVSFEFEADLPSKRINFYIHTQDGAVSGLYASYDMNDSSKGGYESIVSANYPVIRVEGLGWYWGLPNQYAPVGTRDENTYMMIDEVRIDSGYIGPPPGFLSNPPPSSPSNAR